METWAVLEQLGHRRSAGRLTEEEKFGGKIGRLDVPQSDGSFVTTYFGAASVYSLTVVSEEAARAVALHNNVHPVQSWEMPRPAALPAIAAGTDPLHDEILSISNPQTVFGDDDDKPF